MFDPNDPKWKVNLGAPKPGDHDYQGETRRVTVRIREEDDEPVQRDAHEIAGIRTPTQRWHRNY
jgi:hypothetical protein